jgi:hypothetical protein
MVVNGEQLVKSSSMELVVLNAFEKVQWYQLIATFSMINTSFNIKFGGI